MENTLSKNLLNEALDHYDRTASRYFDQKIKLENSPQDIREAHKKELASIKKHLDNQRVNTRILADIQSQLEEYQEVGRQALVGTRSESKQKQDQLLAERHHRTDILEKMLKAACRPKPSQRHTAHHIVSGKGKLKITYLARVEMHLLGVRINDPDNGVWLPTTKADTPLWSMPEALGHKQYHTDHYEVEVANRVSAQNDEKQLRFQLKLIAKQMMINKFPIKEGVC